MESDKLLEICRVTKTFSRKGRIIEAVKNVTAHLDEGETLGIVGESGCGKTTLGRIVVGLTTPDTGRIRLQGKVIQDGSVKRKFYNGAIQMVFQDPFGSLNPRRNVSQIFEESRQAAVRRGVTPPTLGELLRATDLRSEYLKRYPHEFSGGQRQRIAIGRALASRPELIVFDEAVSALDVSVQAKIINLLSNMQAAERMSAIFITHDIAVVGYVANRVAVMYNGEIVECRRRVDIFRNPSHPYTKQLFAAIPKAEVR